MFKAGLKFLLIWSYVNFFLAALILIFVLVVQTDSPILPLVFGESEIASMSAKTIESLNTLTILYNSCSAALSVLAWFIIKKCLMAGQKWAFWALLSMIGFVEAMAFIASAPIGNARWQVNVGLSVLYIVGIGLTGYALFGKRKNLS